MKLKASLVNKSLFGSDMKRFWWMAVLNALGLFFFGTFIMTERILDGYQRNITIGRSDFYGMYVVGIIFAVLSTVSVFTYLSKSGSVAEAHALPLKRHQHFFSHLLSAFTLTALPMVLNILILLLYRFNSNVWMALSKRVIISAFVVYLAYTLIMISLTAFSTMITGSSVASVIFTVSIALIPIAIESFLREFFRAHVYGYINSKTFLSETLYLSPEKVMSSKGFIYVGLIVVLTLLALLLYKIRRLECNGEVVAFIESRPIFIYTVAVFAGIAGYLYFGNFFDTNIFFLLPFGILGIIIAYMISQKSFNLRGVHVPIIVFVVFVTALFYAIKLDLAGYEKRMPEFEEIKSVEINDYSSRARTRQYIGTEYVYFDDVFDPRMTNPNDIEKVYALHKHMIEDRQERDASRKYVHIVYHLENGKTLERAYYPSLKFEEDAKYLGEVYDLTHYRKTIYELADGTKKNIESVTISDNRVVGLVHYTDDMVEKLADAMIKDMIEVSYKDNPDISEKAINSQTWLEFKWTKDMHYEDDRIYPEKFYDNYSYRVPSSYKNTWAVLDEIGYTDNIPGAEDIAAAEFRAYRYGVKEMRVLETMAEGVEISYVAGSSDKFLAINDREILKSLYEFLTDDMIDADPSANYRIDGEVKITFRDGHVWSTGLYIPEDIVPENLRAVLLSI